MKRVLLLLITFFSFSLQIFSQTDNRAEMADVMRGNGKIYVVVAVMLTILAGLILYLVRIDRKLSKLEKQTNK